MKTNVALTSIKCFKEITLEGKIGKRQRQILEVMDRNKDYSLQELCAYSHLPVNVVSARVNELKNKGILIALNKRKCMITRRTIKAVELSPLYV